MRLAPLASGLSGRRQRQRRCRMPHDCAIGPALAVTISPPVAIITNMAYST